MKLNRMITAFFLFYLTSPIFGEKLMGELQELLASTPQIAFKEIGKTILIHGEAGSLDEFFRITRHVLALQDKGEPITASLSLSIDGKEAALHKMRGELGETKIRVRFLENQLMVEGIAESEFEADRAIMIIKGYLFQLTNGAPTNKLPGVVGFNIVDLLRILPKKADKGT